MNSSANERKAALALCALPHRQRDRVLNTLPSPIKARVSVLIDHIRSQGWTKSPALRHVLEEMKLVNTSDADMTVEQWVALSRLVAPVVFARILVSCSSVDRTFLVSLLERDYGAAVMGAVEVAPQLPQKLAETVLAWGQQYIQSQEVRECAA